MIKGFVQPFYFKRCFELFVLLCLFKLLFGYMDSKNKKNINSESKTADTKTEVKNTENKKTEVKNTVNKKTEDKKTEVKNIEDLNNNDIDILMILCKRNSELQKRVLRDKKTVDKKTEDKKTEDKNTEDKKTEDKETEYQRRLKTRAAKRIEWYTEYNKKFTDKNNKF